MSRNSESNVGVAIVSIVVIVLAAAATLLGIPMLVAFVAGAAGVEWLADYWVALGVTLLFYTATSILTVAVKS